MVSNGNQNDESKYENEWKLDEKKCFLCCCSNVETNSSNVKTNKLQPELQCKLLMTNTKLTKWTKNKLKIEEKKIEILRPRFPVHDAIAITQQHSHVVQPMKLSSVNDDRDTAHA